MGHEVDLPGNLWQVTVGLPTTQQLVAKKLKDEKRRQDEQAKIC
jgi:hypothetical protein